MPLQFTDYPLLEPEHSSSWTKGLSDALKQQLMGIKSQKEMAELPYAGEMARSTAAYKTAMANYLNNPYQMQRFMTPLGKLINEMRNSGRDITPDLLNKWETSEDTDDAANVYRNKIFKETTDPQARRSNIYSTNIEKTSASINPEHLTKYSGIPGMFSHGMDLLESIFGKTPNRLANYEEASRNSDAMATQIRQFYGDSITPQVREELQFLTNPSSWKYDQKTAMNLYNKYLNLLNSEMQTYRDVGNSPDAYGFKFGSKSNQTGSNFDKEEETRGNPSPSFYPNKSGDQYSTGSKLLSKSAKFPKFKTTEKEEAWYKNQIKTVRNAYRLHLSKGNK